MRILITILAPIALLVLFLVVRFHSIRQRRQNLQWLYGTWQSEKDATEDYLIYELRLPQPAILKLGTVLGKMRVTYTPSEVLLENCELAGTYKYQILSSSRRKLQLQLVDNAGNKGAVSTIRFVSATEYWSGPLSSVIPGFKEKFRKVANDEKSK